MLLVDGCKNVNWSISQRIGKANYYSSATTLFQLLQSWRNAQNLMINKKDIDDCVTGDRSLP